MKFLNTFHECQYELMTTNTMRRPFIGICVCWKSLKKQKQKKKEESSIKHKIAYGRNLCFVFIFSDFTMSNHHHLKKREIYHWSYTVSHGIIGFDNSIDSYQILKSRDSTRLSHFFWFLYILLIEMLKRKRKLKYENLTMRNDFCLKFGHIW